MRCAKRSCGWLLLTLAFVALGLCVPYTVQADIVPLGDVYPGDPWDWYYDGVTVGDYSGGTITVDSGSVAESYYTAVGNQVGVPGMITVDGPSQWINDADFTVGIEGQGIVSITNGGTIRVSDSGYFQISSTQWSYSPNPTPGEGTVTVDGPTSSLYAGRWLGVGMDGQGTLNILNGGQVATEPDGATYVAPNPGSSGTIFFGGNGAMLTTGTLYASPTQLTGTGTIHVTGLVSDVDLTFDSIPSLSQTLTLNGAGQSINVNLDISQSNSVGELGVGYMGAGMLTIRNGVTIVCADSILGHSAGSSGTATVDGGSSTWIVGKNAVSRELIIGNAGSGILSITNGGSVQMDTSGFMNVSVSIAAISGSTGAVTVSGSNSTMTDIGKLRVGENGTGSLTISGGAAVDSGNGMSSSDAVISSGSFATVTGPDSTWTNYSNIKNSGTLNILDRGQVINDDGTTFVDGSINFGSTGGTLATKSLYARAADLSGTGTIQTRGLVGDGFGLVFDSGPTLTMSLTGAGQNIAVNLDMSNSNNVGDLGAGYYEDGQLTIQNGTVYSANGNLGYMAASAGTATVTGAGKWIIPSTLYVGRGGYGKLMINNGGYVESQTAYVAYDTSTSNGTIRVDGPGTEWKNTGDIYIGHSMPGDLRISNGALVEVGGTTYLGPSDYTRGTVTFGGTGGTLSTRSLYTAPQYLRGTGTVITRGLIGDMNLVFDGTSTGTASLLNGGTVTINVEAGDSNNVGDLGAGYRYSGTVTIQNDATVYSNEGHLGVLSSGVGTMTVTGTSTLWNVNSDIYIGEEGSGLLQVANGATVNNATTYIGYGNTGAATVQNGGLWNHGSDLIVGFSGYNMGVNGTLDISSGTVTDVNGSVGTKMSSGGTPMGYGAGTVTVGNDSLWANSDTLAVGGQSQQYGTLVINNGGTVTAGVATRIGNGQSGIGSVVFGGGTLETKTLYTAPTDLTGTGTIAIRGLVSDVDLTFDSTHGLSQTVAGFASGLSVNLDMSDSTKVGDLGVSYIGNGSLLIDGVAVVSANGSIGSKSGSVGVATVSGTGGQWTVIGQLVIARDPDSFMGGGNGTLNIQNGGTVAINVISMGNNATINFDGGVLTPHDADNNNWIPSGHTYIKEDGATFDTAGHNMRILAVLEHGGIDATDGGIIKTGAGTLSLAFASNSYTGRTTVQEGNLLLVASNTPAAWGPVLTGGGADIQGGKLVFDYSDFFAMDPASTVAGLLDASYGTGDMVPWTTGQFHCSTTGGTDTVHGLGWIDDTENEQVIVMYTLNGDTNLDGSVNGTDLNAVLSYYNQSGEKWEHGDFNYDGSVNGTDLNTVLSNYNQSMPASTAAVPEPSTLLLTIAGLACLLAYVMRKRK